MELLTLLTEDRLEEAIAAVKELASKQPSYTTARPMTEQQKMVQEKRKLLWSGKKNKVYMHVQNKKNLAKLPLLGHIVLPFLVAACKTFDSS